MYSTLQFCTSGDSVQCRGLSVWWIFRKLALKSDIVRKVGFRKKNGRCIGLRGGVSSSFNKVKKGGNGRGGE